MIYPNLRERNIGWFYWAFQLLVLPTLLVTGSHWLGCRLNEVWLNIWFFLLNLVCGLVIFFRYLTNSIRHFTENLKASLSTAVIGFFLYYGASMIVNILLLKWYPEFLNVNNLSIQFMLEQEYVLMTLCTVFCAPITEEILYRGLVFGHLRMKSRVLAYIVSALIFCSIHVVGYIGSYPIGLLILCFLQYVPAGVFLSWSYERSGTICTSILIHIAINAIGVLAMR